MGDFVTTAAQLAAACSSAPSAGARRRHGALVKLTDDQRGMIAVTFAWEIARCDRSLAYYRAHPTAPGRDEAATGRSVANCEERRAKYEAILLAVSLYGEEGNRSLLESARLRVAEEGK